MANLYDKKYSEIFNNGSDVHATSFDWGITFYEAPNIFTGGKLLDNFLNSNALLKTVGWGAPDIPDSQPLTVNVHGHYLSQPGLVPTNGTVQIRYQDTVSMNITRYYNALIYAMDDPLTHSTNGRSPANFRFGFYIDKLDPAGNTIKRWNCYPCILSSVTGDDNQGTSDKTIQGSITAAFQVDFYKIFYPNSDGSMPKESCDTTMLATK